MKLADAVRVILGDDRDSPGGRFDLPLPIGAWLNLEDSKKQPKRTFAFFSRNTKGAPLIH